jgi:methylated-DNA-[protein]-cysteine S-methyltransferase
MMRKAVSHTKVCNNLRSSGCFFKTDFGTMAVIWSEYKKKPAVSQIFIPKPKTSTRKTVSQSFPGLNNASCDEVDKLINQIKAFMTGENIRFYLDILRMDLCTLFQEKVLRAEFAIPRGRVSSYGLIARHLNKPGAARAVGTALATNLFPIVIPCHRTVRSDGHIGGYQGGLPMKRKLLQMEAVAFLNGNHVALENFYYQNG